MKVYKETIPHSSQRYDTAGDYVTDSLGLTHITVSNLGNPDYEFLVGIHEEIEEYLCRIHGIKEEDITAWDLAHIDHPDPGSIPSAPYHHEHMLATTVERMLCREMGYTWDAYDHIFETLVYTKEEEK